MKILLDTHIWLWYLLGSPKLSPTLQIEIRNSSNELWLSPISVWETLMLAEKRKITLTKSPEEWLEMAFATLEVTEAPLTNQIAILSRNIELPHQDPADRFIATTALYYDLVLATVDNNLTSAKEIPTLS